MRFRTMVGMSVVAIALVVGGEIQSTFADWGVRGPSPVRVERRYAFTIRTINGYIKHIVIWAPRLSVAIDRLRENHPYAKIINVDID
jgi:hypothetical protein